MNVKSVEKQEKSTVELVIEISREEFETAIEKVYKRQRGKISVPGFRKGKAPRKIIEGMYGSGVFHEDAINEVYPVAYAEAVAQEKLDAVAWPQVEIQEVSKEGFTFKALVTVRPEVVLGEYKGLVAPRSEVTISDTDIDGELKPLVTRATRVVTVEREAKMGDTTVIDFEGFKDGLPFDGGKAEGHELALGSSSFIPGFEEQVVGMSAKEEKEISVTFPTDYHVAELAGQPVIFKVKVNEVKEKQEPTLDDEFAKDVSEFETLEELKKDLSTKLRERREKEALQEFEEALMEQVCDNMECEIPDVMVSYEAEKLLDNYARRITSQGIPFENYLSMMGLSMNDMQEQAREGALYQVRRQLATGAIIATEGLEVSEEEIEAEIKKLAEEHSITVEQVKAAVPEGGVRADLLQRKASNVVFDSAKVGEVPVKDETDSTEGEEKPKKKAPRKTTKKKEEDSEEKIEE